MRGVSTVLDAALCLLLVTASALLLAGGPHAHESDRDREVAAESADEIAEVLATSTARVSYVVDGRNRTTHDTLAGLLASAARVAAQGDGSDAPSTDPETPASAFAGAVTDAVERKLGRTGVDVQVVARHPPPRDAPADGRVVAGGTPPPGVDVHAAGFVVRQVRLTVRTWST